jgi:hypothetical protein
MHWAKKIDSEDYTPLELQAKQWAEALYRLCQCGREALYRHLAKVCWLSRYKRFFSIEDTDSYFF